MPTPSDNQVPQPDSINRGSPPSSQTPDVPTQSVTTTPSRLNHPILRVFAGFLIVTVVVVASFSIYHIVRNKPKTSVATKLDIPLITYGTDGDGPTNGFYPHNSSVLNTPTDENKQIFEGLVQFEGLKQIKPLLATGWTNPDDNTWIFALRNDVKFHTGHTMTAKDVKYSLENFKDSDVGKTYNTTIKSVDVIDDTHVKITTDGPDPILLNRLTFLYIIDSAGKVDDPASGTGPFTLKTGTVPTDKEAQLVAFDDWHGGRPYVRAITYKVFDDEATMMAAYKKGDITVASNLYEDDSLKAVGSDYRIMTFIDIAESVLQINTKYLKTALADKRVRQAFYNSLDQASLLKARGLIGAVQNQIVPREVPGYNPDIPAHVRDVAAAKQLLKDAGHPNGVTITYAYASENGADLPNEVVKEAAEAGITVKLVVYDDPDKFNNDIEAHKLEMWAYAWNTSLLDAIDVFTPVFQSKNYSNPTIDAKIAATNKTIDPSKRLAMLQQISKDLMDDVAWIPMYSHNENWAVPSNYVINRDWPGEALGVNFGKVYATNVAKTK